MKVLYISNPETGGGAPASMLDVILRMRAMGVDVTAVTAAADDYKARLDAAGIHNVQIGHRAAMQPGRVRLRHRLQHRLRFLIDEARALKALESQLDLGSYDLIHTNSIRTDVGALAARRHCIPHVVHIREFGEADYGCSCNRAGYARFMDSRTDRFIAISEAVRRCWIEKGIPPEKILTIYNGVDESAISHADESAYTAPTLRLVMVGGIWRNKGQHQAVEAMAMLPPGMRENTTLDIIGEGDSSYIAAMAATAKAEGLNVRFTGQRDNAAELLKDYHAGLMCSRSEGFGRVTAEYMHAALCVIASDTGANPELVADGRTGLLYRWGDPEDLAEKIGRLHSDRTLLRDLALAGREEARERFTADLNARRIMHVYEACLV